MLVSGKERSLMILGVDVLIDAQMREYSMTGESADIPDPLLFLARPDSILVTKTMADREGFKLDQKIKVQNRRRNPDFPDPGILNPEGPAKAMAEIWPSWISLPRRWFSARKAGWTASTSACGPREDLETVRRAVANALPKGYMVDTPAGRSKQVAEMLSRFQDALNVISYLAIFVGMYLIYNAVSISVVHRRREIGILRAIGGKRKEIILLFLGKLSSWPLSPPRWASCAVFCWPIR